MTPYLIPKFNVDVSLEKDLDDVDLAADGGLVQGRASGRPDVDVEAGRQDLGHDVSENKNQMMMILFFGRRR
jgi:hypothetical protein